MLTCAYCVHFNLGYCNYHDTNVGGDDVICTAMKYNIESSTLEENLLYDGEDH